MADNENKPRKIAILSTSTCSLDYYKKELPSNLFIARCIVNMDGKNYLDAKELKAEDFNKWMMDNPGKLATTMPPDVNVQAEFLMELQTKGYTDIIVVTLGKNLSESFEQAHEIAGLFENKLNVEVFDSGVFSIAEGAFALKAANMALQGNDTQHILNTLELMKRNCAVYVLVDNLHYLSKNGWLSLSMNVLGSLLQIKPVIKQENSSMDVFKKIRKTESAVHEFADFVNSELNEPNTKAFGLCSGDKKLFIELEDKIPSLDADNSYPMSPVIGSHVGPNVVGVAIFKNTDQYNLDI